MLVPTGCLSHRLEAEAGVRGHGAGAAAAATALRWQGAGTKPPPLAVGKGGHFPLRPSGRTHGVPPRGRERRRAAAGAPAGA